jgi:uncharacterized ion transporter superfamily protein YfcC
MVPAAAVLVGLVGGPGEEGTVTGIIAGAGDFIGAALIIAVARGVTTIMNNAGITDTVLHAQVVTAYQSASGWMNLFTPTSAVVMGGLALSRVRYDRFLRFVAPLLGILLVLTCLAMLLGVAVPALGGPVK